MTAFSAGNVSEGSPSMYRMVPCSAGWTAHRTTGLINMSGCMGRPFQVNVLLWNFHSIGRCLPASCLARWACHRANARPVRLNHGHASSSFVSARFFSGAGISTMLAVCSPLATPKCVVSSLPRLERPVAWSVGFLFVFVMSLFFCAALKSIDKKFYQEFSMVVKAPPKNQLTLDFEAGLTRRPSKVPQ